MLNFEKYNVDYIKQSFLFFLDNEITEGGYHATFKEFYSNEMLDAKTSDSCVNIIAWYLYHKARYLSRVIPDDFDVLYWEVEMILKKGGRV